jgi:hypothetical protein
MIQTVGSCGPNSRHWNVRSVLAISKVEFRVRVASLFLTEGQRAAYEMYIDKLNTYNCSRNKVHLIIGKGVGAT